MFFKITYQNRCDDSFSVNYYSDDESEHLRMIACLRTIAEDGRLAIVTEGDREGWERQREEERTGVFYHG